MSPDRHERSMLPIPDRPSRGLTTYDAKDPDTAFPPMSPWFRRWVRPMC
jgi:arylsulfatase